MSTRSRIAIPSTGGRFKSIYCHWDGEPAWVGRILVECYASATHARALIKVGDISTLCARLAPDKGVLHTFDNPVRYTTVAYGRDRGDEDCQALTSNNFSALVFAAGECNAEYVYVFAEGKWLYTPVPWLSGVPLPTASDLREVPQQDRLSPTRRKKTYAQQLNSEQDAHDAWLIRQTDADLDKMARGIADLMRSKELTATQSQDMDKLPYEPNNLLAKMQEELTRELRASGRTVIEETEPSDGPEFTVTFPPNRPKSPPKP